MVFSIFGERAQVKQRGSNALQILELLEDCKALLIGRLGFVATIQTATRVPGAAERPRCSQPIAPGFAKGLRLLVEIERLVALTITPRQISQVLQRLRTLERRCVACGA